ncbi:hypothetical protein ACNTMW_23830 [Planosporangium sp. 12N6]|uniref:hypothetical protein n=1 Tax=Planosporangium spinosum TaxID=3402278 RepID=UPI003CE8DFB8
MELLRRWSVWLAATAVAVVSTALLPAAAWADGGPAVALVGDELARRPRRGGTGLASACCCLVVVLAIVLVVMLVRRRRQPPPPPPPQ